MLILKSNSFISNRRIVHLIPFFDLMYRKAFDCVNSTQKKCKWKQRWNSHLTFDSSLFFSSNELSFPRGERRKKKDVIHHYIDLVSHPFLLPSSPSLILNIYTYTFKKKEFVKLDKRRESKYFFSRSKRIKIRLKMIFIWIIYLILNTGSIWVLQLLVVGVSY
jgi:hypothetical protein